MCIRDSSYTHSTSSARTCDARHETTTTMSHECRGSGTRRHRPTCCAVIFIVHDRACACRTRLLLLLLLLLLLMLRLLLLLLFGTCVVAHTAHEKEHAAPRRCAGQSARCARDGASGFRQFFLGRFGASPGRTPFQLRGVGHASTMRTSAITQSHCRPQK